MRKSKIYFLALLVFFILSISFQTTDFASASNKAQIPVDTEIGEKIWVGGSDPRPDTWLKLFRSDGITITAVPSAPVIKVPTSPDVNGRFLVSWPNIEQEDSDGYDYIFLVRETNEIGEEATPAGYIKTEYKDTVTNTAATTVIIRKQYVGGTMPPVSFQIFQKIGTGTPTPLPDGYITLNGNEPTPWEKQIILPAVTQTTPITAITYTVVEGTKVDTTFTPGAPPNYTGSTAHCPFSYDPTKEDSNCWVFTNTYVPPTPVPTQEIPRVDYTAYKVWSANSPETKPTITFQLYRALGADGVSQPLSDPSATQHLPPGKTQVTWEDLPASNSTGTQYFYSFRESPVTNYLQSYSTDGKTVTNTYQPPKISITVNKYWTGNQYPRPTIQIKLYQNGNDTSTVTLSNTTSYTWGNLDQYDANGNAYVYTVDEPNVPTGYSKTVSGYTITNTYVGPAYTGDDRSARTYAAILCASLLGIGLLLYFNKRRGQAQP